MSSMPKPPPKLIAVIDDDASFRLATDRFLRSRGYAVETFSSAADFLRSDRSSETSCVITDVRMPTMGGIELQATVRAQGRSLPFIFMTAFPEPAVRLQALHDGATCFLSKPFDAPTLLNCLETALGADKDQPET
jgi:FixJ family two-component response regulator